MTSIPFPTAPLKILRHPDPRLYTRCAPVPAEMFGSTLGTFLSRMLEIMWRPRADGQPQGVGLAGPQVGFMYRVLVMHVEGGTERAMVNPVILDASTDDDTDDESCLSCPDLTVPVLRAVRVVVTYQLPFGAHCTESFSGLEARVVQHEIDHLNGRTLVKRLEKSDRLAYERRWGRTPGPR